MFNLSNTIHKTISALIVLLHGVQVTSSLIKDTHIASPVDNLPTVAPITDRLKTEQSYRTHWTCPECDTVNDHAASCNDKAYNGYTTEDTSGGYDSSEYDSERSD
ncbi:hypothetical protein PSTT_00973 [Puccinia striiformis]|uniref:Uncharacterized protein n=1 Tax=Puccinia striiformis TaxID=27350 RepID=A0A2S4W537_9BASI|nr:hypothetical protein PSTT_00973 [Puccinia striiformis]